MKFLADESVDVPVYNFLKEQGFDIEHILFGLAGSADIDVLELADQQKRILLTVDKDFGELVFRMKRPSVGIVLYRLGGLQNSEKAQIIFRVLTERKKELPSHFTVVTKTQVRVRKLIL
ncbi:MAG: DUF5615 family PIN-like protein [Bacteroidetes bacterium]|nr:DUF5615 family PIN-like protein [Bacteroidota bacterium]MBS1540895.1 DUF5615 family PIN-like protein [Bacteroidota bacterium]